MGLGEIPIIERFRDANIATQDTNYRSFMLENVRIRELMTKDKNREIYE